MGVQNCIVVVYEPFPKASAARFVTVNIRKIEHYPAGRESGPTDYEGFHLGPSIAATPEKRRDGEALLVEIEGGQQGEKSPDGLSAKPQGKQDREGGPSFFTGSEHLQTDEPGNRQNYPPDVVNTAWSESEVHVGYEWRIYLKSKFPPRRWTLCENAKTNPL